MRRNCNCNCCLHRCLQGGLPTFLDVGQSFSASSLTEDNLLHQLQAQGKRIVRPVAQPAESWCMAMLLCATSALPPSNRHQHFLERLPHSRLRSSLDVMLV